MRNNHGRQLFVSKPSMRRSDEGHNSKPDCRVPAAMVAPKISRPGTEASAGSCVLAGRIGQFPSERGRGRIGWRSEIAQAGACPLRRLKHSSRLLVRQHHFSGREGTPKMPKTVFLGDAKAVVECGPGLVKLTPGNSARSFMEACRKLRLWTRRMPSNSECSPHAGNVKLSPEHFCRLPVRRGIAPPSSDPGSHQAHGPLPHAGSGPSSSGSPRGSSIAAGPPNRAQGEQAGDLRVPLR